MKNISCYDPITSSKKLLSLLKELFQKTDVINSSLKLIVKSTYFSRTNGIFHKFDCLVLASFFRFPKTVRGPSGNSLEKSDLADSLHYWLVNLHKSNLTIWLLASVCLLCVNPYTRSVVSESLRWGIVPGSVIDSSSEEFIYFLVVMNRSVSKNLNKIDFLRHC